jgi:hypothetical protein
MAGRRTLLALFAATIIALILLRLVPAWVPASSNGLTELLYAWGLWVREDLAPADLSAPGIRIRDLMQVVVTIIFSAAALFAIFSKRFEAADKNWAYGAVAAILGYWLAGSD